MQKSTVLAPQHRICFKRIIASFNHFSQSMVVNEVPEMSVNLFPNIPLFAFVLYRPLTTHCAFLILVSALNTKNQTLPLYVKVQPAIWHDHVWPCGFFEKAKLLLKCCLESVNIHVVFLFNDYWFDAGGELCLWCFLAYVRGLGRYWSWLTNER